MQAISLLCSRPRHVKKPQNLETPHTISVHCWEMTLNNGASCIPTYYLTPTARMHVTVTAKWGRSWLNSIESIF